MSGGRKGLLLGAIQIALVLSLGGKLLYDRVTRPRVWVLSQVYDPDLPIRGRYLSEQLRLPAEGFAYKEPEQRDGNPYQNRQWAYFEVRDGQLIAKPQGSGSAGWVHVRKNSNDGGVFCSDRRTRSILRRRARQYSEPQARPRDVGGSDGAGAGAAASHPHCCETKRRAHTTQTRLEESCQLQNPEKLGC
jgi:hypothetical protein